MPDPFWPALDRCVAALVARPAGDTRTSLVLSQGASLRSSTASCHRQVTVLAAPHYHVRAPRPRGRRARRMSLSPGRPPFQLGRPRHAQGLGRTPAAGQPVAYVPWLCGPARWSPPLLGALPDRRRRQDLQPSSLSTSTAITRWMKNPLSSCFVLRTEPALLVPDRVVDLRRTCTHQDAPSHAALRVRRPASSTIRSTRHQARNISVTLRSRLRLVSPAASARRPRLRDPLNQPRCRSSEPDIAKDSTRSAAKSP